MLRAERLSWHRWDKINDAIGVKLTDEQLAALAGGRGTGANVGEGSVSPLVRCMSDFLSSSSDRLMTSSLT